MATRVRNPAQSLLLNRSHRVGLVGSLVGSVVGPVGSHVIDQGTDLTIKWVVANMGASDSYAQVTLHNSLGNPFSYGTPYLIRGRTPRERAVTMDLKWVVDVTRITGAGVDRVLETRVYKADRIGPEFTGGASRLEPPVATHKFTFRVIGPSDVFVVTEPTITSP